MIKFSDLRMSINSDVIIQSYKDGKCSDEYLFDISSEIFDEYRVSSIKAFEINAYHYGVLVILYNVDFDWLEQLAEDKEVIESV